jgi:threonine aldolase
VLPTSYVDAVGALATQHHLKVHMDGARLLNAAAALQEDPARSALPTP